MWNPIRRKTRTPDVHARAVAPRRLADGTVPTVAWAGERDAHLTLCCPNCGSSAPKPPLLAVTWKIPDHPARTTLVVRCPTCTCRFYDDQTPPDYADSALLERGRVPFYVQQNAGLSLITRPLTQVEKPPGATYLEVGCGFGFGVDFAQRARGWQSRGIDPAPMAALGRELLGIEIESRYLEREDAGRHRCDAILASETIEHVPSPAAFVEILRAALKPGGVLMLTTPDAAALTPAISQGALIQMLSPGLHLVFQNSLSLRRLLQDAGFAHVEIETDALTLVAFASDGPLDMQRDPAIRRRRYRDYLEARAADVPTDGDLFLGFAGRALLEAVNDGDFAAAERAWSRLMPICTTRFGLDLDSLRELPNGTTLCSLSDMAHLTPLNLSSVLYARAILRLSTGTPRPLLEHQFLMAAAAAKSLRRALSDLALDDGMAEAIEWTAMAEAVLCAAEGGATGIVERLRDIEAAPSSAGGARRRREIGERALVHLVNARHYDLAGAVAEAEALHAAPFATDTRPPLHDSERDALFCLAVLDLQPGGQIGRAREYLKRLRASFLRPNDAAPQPLDLYWAALRTEILACERMRHHDDAAALRNEALAVGGGGDPSLVPADLRPGLGTNPDQAHRAMHVS